VAGILLDVVLPVLVGLDKWKGERKRAMEEVSSDSVELDFSFPPLPPVQLVLAN